MSVEAQAGAGAFFGFDTRNPGERQALAPAVALALTLAALPWLLMAPVDTDRAVPLAFLPAVWLGWKLARPTARTDRLLLAWAGIAMLVATLFSDHAARAAVMASAVVWTFAGAVVARNLAGCAAAVRLVMWGLVAGGAAGTVMIRLNVDAHTASFPIYGSVRLFGAHQFAGCAAALGLLARPPSRGPLHILTLFATALVFTGMFWSGSRAPVGALIVMVAVWFWRGTREERRFLLLTVPALALVALACSWTLGAPYAGMGWFSAVQRTVTAAGLEQVSSDRSLFWSETWRHALGSPWIGHGADGYRFIVPAQNGSQPHNVLLQWLVEYGVLGLIPMALLLFRGLRGLFNGSREGLQPWASSALAATAAYGLLDGVFYHATIFMPAAVIGGFAFGTGERPDDTSPAASGGQLLRPVLLAGLLLLLLHSWLGFMLLKARNVAPDSPPARILRAFPSTTYGLQNWINSWRHTRPDLAMDWIHWAQSVSTESASFHLYAAQLYIWKKDYKSAETELIDCLAKVHRLERPDVQAALDTVRALDAGKPAPHPSQP